MNFYSNSASWSGGGGIYLYCGGVVSNCAIVSNTVYYSGAVDVNQAGGGIYLKGPFSDISFYSARDW
jgi:hypothetical protein